MVTGHRGPTGPATGPPGPTGPTGPTGTAPKDFTGQSGGGATTGTALTAEGGTSTVGAVIDVVNPFMIPAHVVNALASPPEVTSPVPLGRAPGAPPKPPGFDGTIPTLRDPPPNGKPPGFPSMFDPGTRPGFKLSTAGSKYEWIGGDEGKVVVGDGRVIYGGERVTHVSGNRFTQIGGANEAHYYSGSKSVIHGVNETTVLGGPQTRFIQGDQENTIMGNRFVLSVGRRTEINVAFRADTWLGGRMEIGVGGKKELVGPWKFETILGVKHTSVIGAKIDHIRGAKIEVGQASCNITYPSIWKAAVGGTVFSLSGGNTFLKSGTVKLSGENEKVEMDQVVVAGKWTVNKAALMKDNLVLKKDLDAAGGNLKASS